MQITKSYLKNIIKEEFEGLEKFLKEEDDDLKEARKKNLSESQEDYWNKIAIGVIKEMEAENVTKNIWIEKDKPPVAAPGQEQKYIFTRAVCCWCSQSEETGYLFKEKIGELLSTNEARGLARQLGFPDPPEDMYPPVSFFEKILLHFDKKWNLVGKQVGDEKYHCPKYYDQKLGAARRTGGSSVDAQTKQNTPNQRNVAPNRPKWDDDDDLNEAELDKEVSLFDKNPDIMKGSFKEGKIKKSLLRKIITEEFEKILGEAGRSWDPGNWREYSPKQEPAEETPDPRLEKANKLWDEITNREALDNAGLNFPKVGYGISAMEMKSALEKLKNMKRNIMHDLLLKYLVGHEEQKEQKQLEAWDPATEPPPSFLVFDPKTKRHPRGKIGLANWYENWVIPAFFGPDGLFPLPTSGSDLYKAVASGLSYYLQLWAHEAYHFTDRRNMGHPRLSSPQRTEPAQGPEEGYAEMPSLADLADDVATEILKDIDNNSSADISRHYGDITYPSGKKEIDGAVNRIRNQKSKFSNLEKLSKAWQEDLAKFILNVLNSEKPQKEKEEPSDYELPPEIDREEFETATLDDPDFLDRMASLARNENKMKLTRKQLARIIKEEVQSVLDEGGRKKKKKKEKRKEYTGPTVPELVVNMPSEEGYKSHIDYGRLGQPGSAEFGVEDILRHFYYPLSKESKRLIDEVVNKLMNQKKTGDINNRAYAALKEVGVDINSYEFPDLWYPISNIVGFLEKVLGR